MTQRTVIATADAPKAIGPYSQAIALGDLIFCSGQVALDPASGELQGDVRAQTRRALENLSGVLRAAGSSLPGLGCSAARAGGAVPCKGRAAAGEVP